jgi:hypothetical protein
MTNPKANYPPGMTDRQAGRDPLSLSEAHELDAEMPSEIPFLLRRPGDFYPKITVGLAVFHGSKSREISNLMRWRSFLFAAPRRDPARALSRTPSFSHGRDFAFQLLQQRFDSVLAFKRLEPVLERFGG